MQGVALVALLVAFTGPWLYSNDGVPPPEWCAPPNFLLREDMCARVVPGTEVISFLIAMLAGLVVGLPTGQIPLAEGGRFTLVVLVGICAFVLPLVSASLMVAGADRQRLRLFHLAACGLAAVVIVLMSASEPLLRSGRFWGIWLYLAAVVALLILELGARLAEMQRGRVVSRNAMGSRT